MIQIKNLFSSIFNSNQDKNQVNATKKRALTQLDDLQIDFPIKKQKIDDSKISNLSQKIPNEEFREEEVMNEINVFEQKIQITLSKFKGALLSYSQNDDGQFLKLR